MALLIALPALLLPSTTADGTQIVVLLSMVAALMTFAEYQAQAPSLIEFRDAPPFNRLRFIALFVTVLALSLITRGQTSPTLVTDLLTGVGNSIGQAMDFPFSPVRLMLLAAPETASDVELASIRTHAGLAYLVSLTALVIFVALVRLMDWPIQRGAFNFFVNLPLFDPTTGGDVLWRLKRDSHFNVALGFLLPFMIPAILKLAAGWGSPVNLTDPKPLIWTMIAWSFLPASMIMRGVALMRIADLIEEKRRRAYAQADMQLV